MSYHAKVITQNLGKNGEENIYLSVRINKKRKLFNLGLKIKPQDFSARRQQALKDSKSFKKEDINAVIHQALEKANAIFLQTRLREQNLSIHTFTEKYQRPGLNKSVYDFVKYNIENNFTITESTKKSHRKLLSLINKVNPDLTFSDLTLQGLLEIDNYLHKTYTNQNNIWQYHKLLKTYINKAIDQEVFMDNPYHKFKVAAPKPSIYHLSKEEIKKLDHLYWSDVLAPHLQDSLHLFLFCCYSSMHYSDVMLLAENNFTKDTIIYTRLKVQKINGLVQVPINDQLRAIIGQGLPKQVTNQRVNQNLKEIQKLVQIKTPLSTKIGRHTYATLFLEAGGTVEVLQKILGHTKISSTMIYAHITSKRKKKQSKKLSKFLRHK